jgi:hypothetical protein
MSAKEAARLYARNVMGRKNVVSVMELERTAHTAMRQASARIATAMEGKDAHVAAEKVMWFLIKMEGLHNLERINYSP